MENIRHSVKYLELMFSSKDREFTKRESDNIMQACNDLCDDKSEINNLMAELKIPGSRTNRDGN